MKDCRFAACLQKLVVAFSVIVVSLGATASEASPLKLMSFNVRFDAGTPSSNANAWISTTGTHRRDLAFNVINDVGPDILGVQEALNNQVLDLQGELTDYGFYGVGRDNGATEGEYSGVFYRSSRFTRTHQGTFWLNEDSNTPGSKFPGTCCARIASWAILRDNQAGNQEYFVLNTHWDHQVQAARDFSAQLIRDRIDLLSGSRPVIVLGDLNATSTNSSFLDLAGANDPNGLQLIDSYREVFPAQGAAEATSHDFSGDNIGSRIDYVLHSDYFHADQASIYRAVYSGSYPSDHYPVTATLNPRLHGDFDFDGDVDGADFLEWQRGESLPPLNASDLAGWEANFGTISQPIIAAIIPEPATACIMLTGLIVAWGMKRHWR